MSKKKTFLLVVLILFIDQASKIYIKTHFELGQEFKIFDGFRIYFIENEGMAWGAKLSDISSLISDSSAKLFLTIFRIFAVCGIGYWLYQSLIKNTSKILTFALTLVFSGALGNIIDSVFYGILFDGSLGQTATIFTSEGYGDLFHGKVVDMLYFPLFKGHFPDWLPFFGGNYFSFFDPVFNVADMAISTGVGLLLVFNKQVFPQS
ncbi:MAG: lipoprotein signal peptidase [Flavobacteriaceae bacterium]|jgi:signal peptidase II|nr:lipoprotein signal peptidase [Formosa sp.]MDG1373789.1 lipoprotein signal peptidase [Flavobacteriaceae bacterium]MDG2498878.1 lipoprotein signal peptidase [Flavobacteriaceae bacterium]